MSALKCVMKTLGDKKGLDHGLNGRRFFLVVQQVGAHPWHLTKYSACPVKLLSNVAVIVSLTFSLLSSVLTSKFRTPSELHNDNFSLSTIAEGSHPNVRKHCDPPRSPPPHCLCLKRYLSGNLSSHLSLCMLPPLPASLVHFSLWSHFSELWGSE